MPRIIHPRRPPIFAVAIVCPLLALALAGGCGGGSSPPSPPSDVSAAATTALREALAAERRRVDALETERDRTSASALRWRTTSLCMTAALAPALLIGVAIGSGARRLAARKHAP